MQIRAYKSADRLACLGIFDSNMPLYFDPSELKYLESWLDAKDHDRILYPSNIAEYFYVLQQDEKVVACGGFYIPAHEKVANVVWGMVENALHKKGLGKKLLAFRVNLIKELYPTYSIVLDTTQHSFRFFEGLGFRVTGTIKNAYGQGLDRYDMRLENS